MFVNMKYKLYINFVLSRHKSDAVEGTNNKILNRNTSAPKFSGKLNLMIKSISIREIWMI